MVVVGICNDSETESHGSATPGYSEEVSVEGSKLRGAQMTG